MTPEPLDADEVWAIIKSCSHRAPTGIRNRALLTVLYRGGLRLDEALKIRPKDLDVKRGTIRVLRGKGDKSRVVGLDEGALAIVQRWLDKRSALRVDGRRRLFCTL